MSFVQSTTGSGGWPMTVFLHPELKPFFGGTYFPPTSRWGRPGFVGCARRARAECGRTIGRGWNRPPTELLERLKMVTGAGGRGRGGIDIGAAPRPSTVAVEQYQQAFDQRHGGFGDAPKFPRPSELLFLLREHARRAAAGDLGQAPLRMATETLRAMAHGRHARSHRRRLSSLLGRRRVAGAALREDAVRPGAARRSRTSRQRRRPATTSTRRSRKIRSPM